MARRPEGWKLRKRGKWWHVRFTHGIDERTGKSKRWSISTGEGDFGRAKERAPTIYADAVRDSGGPNERVVGQRGLVPVDGGLDVLVARWLYSLEGQLDPDTIKVYKRDYAAKWLDRWDEIPDGPAVSLFVQDRMRQVAASTVRKETSALRGFLRFAMGDRAPAVPSIPKRALGTRKLRPAKSVVVDKRRLDKALDELPEWSKPRLGVRFPVRARIIFQYETGLRREAISLIEWGDVRGGVLDIRDEVDKARLGREVPLSLRAQQVLSTLPRSTGPIFGHHDYRTALKLLAQKLGIPHTHLRAMRHNRLTHWALEGVPLPGLQWLAGHKHLSTTAIYAHASKDAAFAHVHKKAKAARATQRP